MTNHADSPPRRPHGPGENRLLSDLPRDEYDRIARQAVRKSFELRETVYEAGATRDRVYFPRSGLMSAIRLMTDGRAAEVAAVGSEGMIGASTLLGTAESADRVFCQIPGETAYMPTDVFLKEVGRSDRFRSVVHRYLECVLHSSAQMVACNVLHSVEERCARWLLICHDRSGLDEFPMTHEFLGLMLGVHRPSVTLVAGALQNAGIISYRHGRMRILDRDRLLEASCECYQAIQAEYERRFP